MKLHVHYLRATSFAVVVIGLSAVIALLAVLLQRLLAQAHVAEAVRQAYLARLAWLVGLVLLLAVVMLTAVVIRYILSRAANPPESFQPLGHVDSWTEAGRRLKAENAPPVAPYDLPGPAPKEKPDEE